MSQIRIIARPNPFEAELVYCDIEPGLNLTDIVGQNNSQVFIQIEGVPIPHEEWDDTYPVGGEVVTISVVPGFFGIDIAAAAAAVGGAASAVGGLAGSGAALAVAAAQAIGISSATGLAVAGAIGGVVGMAAQITMLVMPFLVKPQVPSFSNGNYSTGQTGGRFSLLTANNNPAMQYGVIPKLYGEFRFNPPLAGNAYTRIKNAVVVGQSGTYRYAGAEPTQTYHLLLCLGYGPLKIGSLYIGPEGLPVTGEGGVVKACVPMAGTNYSIGGVSTDCLNGDPLALLVGNTPFREVKASKYMVGVAGSIKALKGLTPASADTYASYPRDIEETALSLGLPTIDVPAAESGSVKTIYDGLYQIVTTAQNPTNAEIDIVFDSLYATRMKDNKEGTEDFEVTVFWQVWWKPSHVAAPVTRQAREGGFEVTFDASKWNPGGLRGFKGFSSVAKVRHPCAWTVPIFLASDNDPANDDFPVGGTWDILVIRHSTYYSRGNTITTGSNANLTALRSWSKSSSIWDLDANTGLDDAILMVVEFQASNGLSGSVDAVSVKAKSILKRPVVDTPTAWANNQALKWAVTASPAWAFADVFMGPQLQEPFDKDKVDWLSLIRWANWCDGTTNKIESGPLEGTPKITTYNWYQTEEETMLDRIRTITACGRATWAIVNGLFSVIQDDNFYPVQLLSPRNSRGLEIVKNYPKVPNALRVRYVHKDTWQQDEVIVLDDYYLQKVGDEWVDNWGEAHVPGQGGYKKALTYDVLETQGVTNKAQAKREGRYHIANMRLRPEVFTCEVDFENLVAQRGDCVLLSHDVLLRGWSFGRIKKITAPTQAGGDYFIATDTDFEITIGENFAVQVRSMNTDPMSSVPLAFIEIPVNNPPGKYTELWVGASQADKVAKISVDDLFVFGPLDDEGNPSSSLLAKITQIEYQPDLSARLTMTYAAPGIPAADDGIIDDDGSGPKPPPGVLPPPAPTALRLKNSDDTPEITRDGFRFTVIATWDLPITSERIDYVEVHYQVDEGEWRTYQALPTEGSYSIKSLPPETQVRAEARCTNPAGGSAYTPQVTIVTPSEDQFAPKMPINLDLVQMDYREANGRVLYFIQATWTVVGYTGGTHIEWIKLSDIPDDDVWPDDKKQSAFVEGGSQFYEIKGIEVTTYVVRIRSKSLVLNDQYSAWNEGEIEIQIYDYPPSPPTNLQAKSTPSGIMLTWDNPLDNDFAGIEIWENIANTRGGLPNNLPPVPAASMLQRIPNPGNSFFHVPDDRIWHYYWIKSYDTEDGITPSQYSLTWEKPGDTEGVRGRQGTYGDGLPPPPPINLVLIPGVWQISLQWEQSQEILDLFGTQIYFSKMNDRGPDEALLATYLGVTDENFATHLDLDAGDTYYYWIRNIDVENLTSTWLPADRYGGAAATVSNDPRKYLELLNGAITETELAQSLLTLINTQGLEGNSTFIELKQVVEALKALFTLKIQQSFEGLTEVSGFGMGSEVQNNQIVSQFLVQADRFAVGAPAVYNADEVLLVPIQYDWEGNLPTVYDKDGNVITPYGFNGLPLPASNPETKGFIRTVYDAEGNRVPIYDAEGNYFPTPRWDGFIVTTEEYVNSEGKMIPPGVYIRNANIAEGSIDGAKIRANSIKAKHIDTTGLVIKDAQGHVIFSANEPIDLEALFGKDIAEALGALKDKNIHLYIKNGVIGDLYIADELSSVDYAASYYTEDNEYVPGTGWRIHRGTVGTESVIGSPSIIETDNLEARGTLSSDIYVPGVMGWKVFKDGSCEFNNGVFRGTLGAETLLIGTDFNLGQLSEQILLASLNILPSGQFFKYSAGGNPYGDVTLAFHVNVLDNIVWSATAQPAGTAVTLTTDENKPRYRFLSNTGMVEGVDYIEVRATFQDRYDVVKIYKLQDESGVVKAFATNARINLAADSRGNVSNFSRATGRIRVFNGTDEVAKTAVAYSIVAATGCSASIVNDPTKVDHGTYKITGNTAVNGSFTVRATYNGVNYDEVIDFAVYQAVLTGTPGEDGAPGVDGERGSKYFLFFSYDPGGYDATDWTETQPASDPNKLLPPSTAGSELLVDAMVKSISDGSSNGQVVLRDVVTLINYTSGYQSTRMRTQAGWVELAAYIAGNMLVDGTLYAKHIVANGITLSDGVSSKTAKTINVGVESSSVANFLSDVTINQYDTLESVLLFANFAIWTPAGGEDTAVTIAFKTSEDGGDTWTSLGTQGYGVPGTAFRILLSYSYQLKIGAQVYDPLKPPRMYRVTVKVPSGEGGAVIVQDRAFTVLGAYR